MDSAIEEKKALAVGDEVEFEPLDEEGEGVIERIHDRVSKLSRAFPQSPQREHVIVANVDQMVIVASMVQPPIRLGLIDRYLIAASIEKLRPVICLNKADLSSESDVAAVVDVYEKIGYAPLSTSARTGAGMEALHERLAGRRSVIVGQSGVGKSSLLNAVEPGLALKTGRVAATRKGSHTTTWVSLLRLRDGGYVVDTPGIREFSIWDLHPLDVAMFFEDIWQRSADCHMSDCTHSHEPDCAVKDAVASGEIDAVRYESYCRLLESIQVPEEPLSTDVERPDEQIARRKRTKSRRMQKQEWMQQAYETTEEEDAADEEPPFTWGHDEEA